MATLRFAETTENPHIRLGLVPKTETTQSYMQLS
jgi:hypothetical protein